MKRSAVLNRSLGMQLRELADENYSTVSQVARFAIGRYLDLLRQAEDEGDGEGDGT